MQITRDDRVRMERAHVLAWPALRTAVIDGWLWRASGGGSQRANSVSTVDFTGADAEAALRDAEARYLAIGAQPRFQTFDETKPRGLADVLRARGYRETDPTVTMFKRPATAAPRSRTPGRPASMPPEGAIFRRPTSAPPAGAILESAPVMEAPVTEAPVTAAPVTEAPGSVETSEHAGPEWLATYLGEITPNRRAANSRIIEQIPAPHAFFGCREGSGVIATALCVVGFGCAVVECVATRADARRRGAARAVLAQLEMWASMQGVDWIGLQVAAHNTPAIRLYEALGFSAGAINKFWVRDGRG